MSEQPTNSYSGFGTPTVPNGAPANIPPPPAAAPLVAPSLPSLSPTGLPALSPAAASIFLPADPQPPLIPTLPGTPPAPSMTPAAPSLQTETAAPAPISPTISSATPTALIGAPTLPPAGIRPLPTEHSKPPLDNLGLPEGTPTDVPREIPEWKRRQNSKGRKLSKRLIQLAVLGALGAGGWFVYQTQLKLKDDTDVTTPDAAAVADPAPDVIADAPAKSAPLAIIDAAQDTVDAINDNAGEDELIGELIPVTSGPFEPNPDAVITLGDIIGDGFVSATAAQSWTNRWVFPNDALTLAVDSSTGDFDANFVSRNDLRFVGGQFFESLDDGATWNAVEPGPDQLTVAGFANSLPTFETALPTVIRDFVILAESNDTATVQVLIDDVALFEQHREARTAWLTAWGLDASIAPSATVGFADEMPATAGAGQILVSIVGSPDGIGTQLTVSAPTAAGTSNYFLVDASDSPRTILAPQIG
jgi:hypothetical protein